jgi:hypothetical protein
VKEFGWKSRGNLEQEDVHKIQGFGQRIMWRIHLQCIAPCLNVEGTFISRWLFQSYINVLHNSNLFFLLSILSFERHYLIVDGTFISRWLFQKTFFAIKFRSMMTATGVTLHEFCCQWRILVLVSSYLEYLNIGVYFCCF